MKKKTWMAAAVISCAVLAATACGSKDEAATTAAAETSAAGESTAADSADAESKADGETEAESSSALSELSVERPESLGTIRIGTYEGIELMAAAPHTVSDAEVEEYISNFVLPSYPDKVEVIEVGDIANIDYVGKMNGVAFEGGTAEGTDLEIGSNMFIEGFEEGLVGKKSGEAVSLDLTFPEDYPTEDLAGQDVVFEVVINEVKRVPETLSDGLAAEIDPEVTSAAEYKEKLKELMQIDNDYNERQIIAADAFQTIAENSEIEVSKEAIDWKVNDLIVNYYEPMMRQSYGVGIEDMLMMQGMTLEEYMEELRDPAEEAVKNQMIMDEIIGQQKLSANEADMEAMAKENHVELSDLIASAGEENVRELTVQEMAIDFVLDNADITYGSMEDYFEE